MSHRPRRLFVQAATEYYRTKTNSKNKQHSYLSKSTITLFTSRNPPLETSLKYFKCYLLSKSTNKSIYK